MVHYSNSWELRRRLGLLKHAGSHYLQYHLNDFIACSIGKYKEDHLWQGRTICGSHSLPCILGMGGPSMATKLPWMVQGDQLWRGTTCSMTGPYKRKQIRGINYINLINNCDAYWLIVSSLIVSLWWFVTFHPIPLLTPPYIATLPLN